MVGSIRPAARTLLLIACLFVLVRSVRIGWADALARSGDPAKIARAIAMEPRNEIWPARLALWRLQNGEASPELRAELERCNRRNPNHSGVLMGLGLLAEQNGNRGEAEQYLIRAAAVDHGFKPAWTLANFYFRTNATHMMWPYLRHCLDLIEPRNLESWSFDPTPIYTLAWEASDDPKAILSVLPTRRETMVPYLKFLSARPQTPARQDVVVRNPILLGLDAWPLVLPVAEAADKDTLTRFLDQLLTEPSSPGAQRVWNNLIDRSYLQPFAATNRLDAGAGHFLADPDFAAPPFDHGFGWRVPFEAGVNTGMTAHSFTLEFTGGEREHSVLLRTYAAVNPQKTYRLQWLFDSVPPKGLHARLGDEDPRFAQNCGLDSCLFRTPPGIYVLPLALRYDRPAGEVRLRGSFTLRGIRMEEVR